MHHTLAPTGQTQAGFFEYTFVTGIFATEAFAGKGPRNVRRCWTEKPRGRIEGGHIDLIP